MKPFAKCICAALVIGILAVAGFLRYSVIVGMNLEVKSKEIYVIEESISPDEVHKVTVFGIGDQVWSFGSQTIAIRFDDDDVELRMDVGNDGGEANVGAITWTDETVQVPISGINFPRRDFVFTFDEEDITVKIK